jgi:hypothetical protein
MSKSPFSGSQSSTNSPYTSSTQYSLQTLSYYTTLASSLTQLNNLIIQYSLGNFSYVAQNLSIQEYNNLALVFNGLIETAATEEYENIRQTINYTLQGLLQSVNQYNTLTSTQNQLTISQQQSDILNNPTLLQEYINNLKNSAVLFPAVSITPTLAILKPEYATYILLYGYPANGVFEIDKLAPILKEFS